MPPIIHATSLRCEVEPYLRYARLGRRQFLFVGNGLEEGLDTSWKIHMEKKMGTGGLVQMIFRLSIGCFLDELSATKHESKFCMEFRYVEITVA